MFIKLHIIIILRFSENITKNLKLEIFILLSKKVEYPWFSYTQQSKKLQWSYKGDLNILQLKQISSNFSLKNSIFSFIKFPFLSYIDMYCANI